jgi:hypothetical protein
LPVLLAQDVIEIPELSAEDVIEIPELSVKLTNDCFRTHTQSAFDPGVLDIGVSYMIDMMEQLLVRKVFKECYHDPGITSDGSPAFSFYVPFLCEKYQTPMFNISTTRGNGYS